MKICPECKSTYDVNMSFCLQDGSPLVVDPEAVTIEKPVLTTSPNEASSVFPSPSSSSTSVQTQQPKRSYFGIIFGLVSLVLLFVVAVAFIGGIWWYSQNRSINATNDPPEIKPDDGSQTEKPTPTAKPIVKGAVTVENFKKLKTGMTYEQVVEILGEEGDQISSADVAGYESATYMWQPGTFSNVTITFQNKKLVSKFQMGLK